MDSGGTIHVKGTDGVTKVVTLYTDPSEVTEVYKTFMYEGQVVYAKTTTDPDYEYATQYRYLDTDGVVRYLCEDEPIIEKSGTVVVNGDLTGDLIVDGNLQVSGTITGNVIASGKITYGSLLGSRKQGAEFDSCCLSVEDGKLTFAGNITRENGGVIYTDDTVTNASGTTSIIYCDITIDASSYALYNNDGILTIEKSATVTATSTSKYGVYNYINSSNKTFTINGTLKASGTHGMYSSSSRSPINIVINSGATVEVKGSSYGFYSTNSYSSITITSNGTITATGGIYNRNTYSSVTFTSSGSITCSGGTYGIYTGSSFGDVSFTSSGPITATGSKYGIYNGDSNGSSSFTSSGTIIATCSGTGDNTCGIYSGSSHGTSTFTANGQITATGGVYGIRNDSSYGSATFTINNKTAAYGTKYGIYSGSTYRTCKLVVNSGATVEATGSSLYGLANDTSFGGEDSSHGDGASATLNGTLTLTGGTAGIYNMGDDGVATMTIGGTTTATGNTYGVYNRAYWGTSKITVSGTLYTNAPSSSNCVYNTASSATKYDSAGVATCTTTGSGKIYKNGVLS